MSFAEASVAEPLSCVLNGQEQARVGAVPVADLITHRLPLERTVEGIHTVAGGEAIKVTVEPS
jgi:Zn-dependent alcohol dehydrogenase